MKWPFVRRGAVTLRGMLNGSSAGVRSTAIDASFELVGSELETRNPKLETYFCLDSQTFLIHFWASSCFAPMVGSASGKLYSLPGSRR